MSDTKRKIFTAISVFVIFSSAVLTAFVYRTPLLRLTEALAELCRSLAYFFVNSVKYVFTALGKEVPQIDVYAAHMPDFDAYSSYIGLNVEDISHLVSEYTAEIFNLSNFLGFNLSLVSDISTVLVYVIPLLTLGYAVFMLISDCCFTPKDSSLGEKSKSYKRFYAIAVKLKTAYIQVKAYVLYFFERKYFSIPFVIIWVVNFGICTVVANFLGWYFYFAESFNAVSVVYMLLRVGLDLLIVVKSVPLVCAVTIFLICRHLYCRSKALELLRRNEAKNCGLIKELELVILIIGEPGKGKTTLMTDIVLSLVNIYKADSLKILYKTEMYFPGFDFASFRAELSAHIADRTIFCVPQIDGFVEELFENNRNLYGYEKELYGDTVKLGNRNIDLKQALIIYGRAFLIYQNNNPAVANYSIRFDGEFDSSEFFKLWDGDFFEGGNKSHYAHVLDSDIMRFGKKVDGGGKFNGSFGYGIWARTEAAKSYGNQVSNSGYNKNSDTANPLNDLVEYSLMMGRHPNASVDNTVFFRMLMDEQRASDLTAKIRELCSIVSIEEKGELQIAIQGYGWLFRLRDKLGAFEKLYLKYNNVRADFTLMLMLPKLFVSLVRLCCERIENVYGYRELTLIKECGTSYSSGGEIKKEPKRLTWYQANMKIYAERFASDCYAGFFTELQKKCGCGIEDYPEYGGLYPTMEEYRAQKDFFLMKMMGMIYGTDNIKDNSDNKNSKENPFEGLIFEE